MARSRNRRAARPPNEKRPAPADKAIPILPDDELELLEVDDEEARVSVTHATNGSADVRLTVAVGDLEKSAVIDAMTPPLRATVDEVAPQLRWRNVTVNFSGTALIPGAAKEVIAELLAAARPLRVVVQRGYGDECVFESSPPTVRWHARADAAYALKDLVEIDTGDLESADLPVALGPVLEQAAAEATGKAYEIAFRGNAVPDDATRELVADTLRAGGAVRVVLAGDGAQEVLFDQILESQVVVDNGADDSVTGLSITLRNDPDATVQAMALVLPRAREQLSGQQVRARFAGRDPRPEELDALLDHAAALGAARVELDTGTEPDLLWPRLLRVDDSGPACTVSLEPEDRSPAAVLVALAREARGFGGIAGKAVTVDFPAGLEPDPDLDAAVVAALTPHRPQGIAYAFAGGDREPVYPPPLELRAEGDGVRCALDTDTGKPAELVRVIERRLPAARAELAGKAVTVEVLGSGAVSRTMLRVLRDRLQAAEVAGVRLRDQGQEDILLPPLLRVDVQGTDVEVNVQRGGRDDEQIVRALGRELSDVDCPDGATLRVAGDLDPAVIEAFVSAGAGRVIAGGVQVHPSLFAAPEREGQDLTLRVQDTPHAADDPLLQVEHEWSSILAAQAGASGDLAGVAVSLVWPGATADDPGVARVQELSVAAGASAFLFDDGDGMPMQLHPVEVPAELEELPETAEALPDEEPRPAEPAPEVAVLGRRDAAGGSAPPMILLGIGWTEDAAAAAEVGPRLAAMADEIAGRRVLVVFRQDGREREGPVDSPLVQTIYRTLARRIPALLLYRSGPPAGFQVVYSTIEDLPRGRKVRDPRRGG